MQATKAFLCFYPVASWLRDIAFPGITSVRFSLRGKLGIHRLLGLCWSEIFGLLKLVSGQICDFLLVNISGLKNYDFFQCDATEVGALEQLVKRFSRR